MNDLVPPIHFIVELINETIKSTQSKEYQRMLEGVPPSQIRSDLKVIRIQLPRRMGHSTAAATMIAQNPNSLLVLFTEEIRYRFKGEFPAVYNHRNILVLSRDVSFNAFRETLMKQIAGKLTTNHKYELLVVDMASMYLDECIDELINIVGPYVNTILLLG